MTKNVAVLAIDLAVAALSIVLFIATPVWLAAHQINSFDAILLSIGSGLAGVVATLRFQSDSEPWPIRIFAPTEMPARLTLRPSLPDWLRLLDWTGRGQRA